MKNLRRCAIDVGLSFSFSRLLIEPIVDPSSKEWVSGIFPMCKLKIVDVVDQISPTTENDYLMEGHNHGSAGLTLIRVGSCICCDDYCIIRIITIEISRYKRR